MELNVIHLKGLIDIFTELEPERILKKAVVRISEILNAKGCSIFLFDEGCDCIELAETTGIVVKEKKHITYKEGEGLTGWVFKNRKPLLLQDFDIATLEELKSEFGDDFNWTGKYSEGEHRKPKSYLAVPITSKGGRFYGIIRTSSVASNFTITDQEILIHVADYISIALENSHHYVQERKKADYFELLMEFGTRLHSHYNLNDLLDFVAEQSALTFSAETCEIYLRDNEDRNKLILRAGFGIPDKLINSAEHQVGEGLTGTLVKENRIIRLNNVLTFPKYKGKYRTEMKKNLRYGDRLAFLGIPISIKNDVIGALKLYNKIPRYEGGHSYFTEDDEKYLAVLGDLLAVAIENLQYLESMKTSA
ncbi:MAG TPA: GAF domain-containing protein, partial [Candidatus Marinimicrobia bacterium]|nr:GAF domain-containing protein [Candidatus Neomarinimicrobiota bacterium]